ncbi:9380_t:CDS:2, partial [Scutellospora calospora]
VRTKQPRTSIKSAQKHGRIKSPKTVVTPVKASPEVTESFENIEYYNYDLRIFFKYINCKQYFLKSKLKIEENNNDEIDEETDSEKIE